MPTSVKSVFENSSIFCFKKVPWKQLVDDNKQGVYIISVSPDPENNLQVSRSPEFNEKEIQAWIENVPNFTIDNEKPTLKLVKRRLTEFWLPDENILYVGQAKRRNNGDALGKRINEYYKTKIGAGSPHSGGQWLKTLSNLPRFFVYLGYSGNPADTEIQMLEYFMKNVSKTTIELLRDKNLPLPFANLRYKRGRDKLHGMKNQRN